MSDNHTGIELPEAPEDRHTVPEVPPNGKPAAGSVVDKLRRRREHLRSHRTTKIDIPGYGGDLIAEYQAIPGGSGMLRVAIAAAGRLDDETLEEAIEDAVRGIAKMCVGIYAKDGDRVVPLNEVYGTGSAPIRFDSQLAKVFGFEAESATDVVRETFPSDDAIQSHAINLIGFLQGVDAEVDEELLGEA